MTRTSPPNNKKAACIESDALLAAIVQSSDDAIIGKDLNGIITSWNPGAESIFGYTAQEVIGHPIELLIPTERLGEEAHILQQISQGKRVRHFETERLCKDGRHIVISATISPIKDSKGKVIGASKIARDITQQKDLLHKFIKTDKELAFQRWEAKRAEELLLINKELLFEKEEKSKRAEELLVINNKLQASLFETVELARQLGEMRDLYTSGHEQSVGDLAEAIAGELGLEKNILDGMRVGGYLHDIGKIIVPIEILVKPTKLSQKEYELVKEHVEAGYKVLKDIAFPWPVARFVLEHHERLDGSGYPRGLKGDEISMGGENYGCGRCR